MSAELYHFPEKHRRFRVAFILSLVATLFAGLTASISVIAAPLPKPAAQPTAPSVEERFSRTVAPGIEFTTIFQPSQTQPLQLFVLRVDPSFSWQLRVSPAEYSVLKRSTVSAISKRENAVAAINGGYFAFGGAALGAVKVDGEWLRLPMMNRTALGLAPGRVLVDTLSASASAVIGGRAIEISNLNGYAPANGFSVVTPHFGGTYKLRDDELAFEIVNGAVRSRVDSGVANILKNGWTLIVRGGARQRMGDIVAGQVARYDIKVPSAWEKCSSILGAGPRLLRNGKIETTEAEENFRPDVIARGPRSAIGFDAKGQIWIVAADGRELGYSMGLTVPELAIQMQKLGCIEAICLDGGGSTAMAVNSILVNRPSDGIERRVANALIVTSLESGEETLARSMSPTNPGLRAAAPLSTPPANAIN